MKDLLISKTKRTPEILFKTNGELSISGSSMAEDVATFYKPVLEWLNEFNSFAPEKISLKIDMDYLSTASTRIALEILRTINDLKRSDVNIIWAYEAEDSDMLEQGELFQTSIKRKFEFLEKKIM